MDRIKEICEAADFTEERYKCFIEDLNKNEDIKEELLFYLDKNDFQCKVLVAGLSLVDIMIWQIDHFRAYLDRDTTLTRNNPQTMIILAVETMLKLRENPDSITKAFESETGTDIII